MGMTIKESLTNLEELQKDYQQFYDDVWQDPESYSIIAESLKVAINVMNKYQKIEKILQVPYICPSWGYAMIKKIKKVISEE